MRASNRRSHHSSSAEPCAGPAPKEPRIAKPSASSAARAILILDTGSVSEPAIADAATGPRPSRRPRTISTRDSSDPAAGSNRPRLSVATTRPGPNPPYRFRSELADVGGGLGIEPAAAHHGLGTPLLERRIVQISVRARVQCFERQRRRLGQVARNHADVAGFELAQHVLETVDVHGIFEAVAYRLPHQRVIRYLDLAG